MQELVDNLKLLKEKNAKLIDIDTMISYVNGKLEKEKEQIIEAWIATDNELQRLSAEEYYNQTYNQNK